MENFIKDWQVLKRYSCRLHSLGLSHGNIEVVGLFREGIVSFNETHRMRLSEYIQKAKEIMI